MAYLIFQTVKRIIRDRFLTDEEAKQNDSVCEQIAAELPELVTRHWERVGEIRVDLPTGATGSASIPR